MIRRNFMCALLLATAAALAAQTPSQQGSSQTSSQAPQYQGVSNPPPDSTITIPEAAPVPKPPAGHPMTAEPSQPQPGAASEDNGVPVLNDDGVVEVAPDETAQPPASQPANEPTTQPATQASSLQEREYAADPDGDIVHPAPLPPGELGNGTIIRARLLDHLSTVYNVNGDTFRARIASDVFRGDRILIPAGSEIDGQVVHVSTGGFAGHGSMHLRPEIVILPDGSRYHLYADLTGTPGAKAQVGSEGQVKPGSQVKKDGLTYGGGVGAGAVTGAVLGGPVGALAGTIVGASAVTAHLLLNHPQVTLPAGTVLLFTLIEPLDLVRESATAN